jgi:hypothetical protein
MRAAALVVIFNWDDVVVLVEFTGAAISVMVVISNSVSLCELWSAEEVWLVLTLAVAENDFLLHRAAVVDVKAIGEDGDNAEAAP